MPDAADPLAAHRRHQHARAAIGLLALFAIISVLVQAGVTQGVDVGMLELVGGWRTLLLTPVMQAASAIGDWPWEVPLALIVCGLLWRERSWTNAWQYFAVCLSAEALYAIAKAIFRRPRPTVIAHLGSAGWYSYPSGHSMLAPVIWGMGLVLVSRLVRSKRARRVLVSLAVVIPIVIAMSRLYLGVHYPTDVLAGLAFGMAWAFLWWDAVKPTDSVVDVRTPG